MNTKTKGELAEISIAKQFLKNGYNVSFPYGDNQRYDLIIEISNILYKVQCKTGKLKDGVLVFNCSNSTVNEVIEGQPKGHYRGQIDYFAVYSPELDKCYLLPVSEVGINSAALRIDPPKNNQMKTIRWAKDFEI